MKLNEATAKSYAKALFELARERDQADTIGGELDTVAGVLARERELRDVLGSPWVGTSAKRGVVTDIAARLGLSPLMRDFLGLVAVRNRAEYVPAILTAYQALADEALGRVRVKLRTAVAMTDAERTRLGARLSALLEGRQLVIEESVDASLLGGFVAEVGSRILDATLDTQLSRMRDRLATA